MNISELIGKTVKAIEKTHDEIKFETNDGVYKMYHQRDCCENVAIEDVSGDLEDLIGSPITMAEESTNSEDTLGNKELCESFTWTFYRLATVKGYVTIRWLGESNGYYSETVDFEKIL